MIQVENLKIKLEDTILYNININVNLGEMVFLVGESGIGKSILCSAILGILPKGAKCEGLITLRGRIGYVPQLSTYLNPLIKIKKQLTNLNIEKLKEVRLDESIINMYPNQLSGGMTKRLALAMALSIDCDILITDELTDGVDEVTSVFILESLKKLKNKAILMVTHSLELAVEYADKIIYLKNKTIASNAYIEDLLKFEPSNYFKKNFSISNVGVGDRLLDIQRLNFSYRNRVIFENFDFYVNKGESVGIFGASGRGKTTLARLIMGRLDESNLLKGVKAFYIGQAPELAFNPLRKLSIIKEENKNINHDLMESLRIEPEWFDRFPSELSGGQLQKMAIIRAIKKGVQLIIADEITSKLDNITQIKIFEFLLEYCKKEGIAVVIISHNFSLLKNVCNRIYEV